MPEVEAAIYRIVQEALTNVARHARAQHVDVLLERRGDRLVVIVEDDGVGFVPEEAAPSWWKVVPPRALLCTWRFLVTIRVLIADDDSVLWAGLRALLNAEPDIDVVGEAGDSYETLVQTEALLPDVLLLDISMPGLGGIEVTRQVRRTFPQVRVLILTVHEDEGLLRWSPIAPTSPGNWACVAASTWCTTRGNRACSIEGPEEEACVGRHGRPAP